MSSFLVFTIRRQPKRNTPKKYDKMAIPSELLDWVVEENYIRPKTDEQSDARETSQPDDEQGVITLADEGPNNSQPDINNANELKDSDVEMEQSEMQSGTLEKVSIFSCFW